MGNQGENYLWEAWKKMENIHQPPPVDIIINKKKKQEAAPLILTLGPMSPSEWDALSPKAKWDSIVALRGPDLVGSTNVKTWTTAIIRHRLSAAMRVGGQINDWFPFVVVPASWPRKGSLQFDWAHFFGHVIEASDWLGIPHTSIPLTVWNNILQDHRGNYVGQLAYMREFLTGDFLSTTSSILTNKFGLSEEGISKYASAIAQKEKENSSEEGFTSPEEVPDVS